MAQTSRRKVGDDVGKAGSSGMVVVAGVTEPARPPAPETEGWADDLRVVADADGPTLMPAKEEICVSQNVEQEMRKNETNEIEL